MLAKKNRPGFSRLAPIPPYFRGQVQHHGGLVLSVQTIDLRLVCQVVILATRDDDVVVAASLESLDNEAAEKPRPASHEDSIIFGVHYHQLNQWHGRPARDLPL